MMSVKLFHRRKSRQCLAIFSLHPPENAAAGLISVDQTDALSDTLLKTPKLHRASTRRPDDGEFNSEV